MSFSVKEWYEKKKEQKLMKKISDQFKRKVIRNGSKIPDEVMERIQKEVESKDLKVE